MNKNALLLLPVFAAGSIVFSACSLNAQANAQSNTSPMDNTIASPTDQNSPADPPSSPSAQSMDPNHMMPGRMRMPIPSGSQPLFGQITSVNGTTITLQRQSRRNQTATTLTVQLNASTQYQNGAQSNLTVGTRIAGYGTTNADGSLTAQMIMINPPRMSPGPSMSPDAPPSGQ